MERNNALNDDELLNYFLRNIIIIHYIYSACCITYLDADYTYAMCSQNV